MTYYIHTKNNKIISSGEVPMGDGFESIEVTEELYNDFVDTPNKYIYSEGQIVLNPNYEQEQAEKRREQFNKDFFETSLGWIRRKVSMKTGETKDFLTDLIPVISLGVSSGQTVYIITYREPDYTQEIVDWESLQSVKQADINFINECYAQVNKDFTGV